MLARICQYNDLECAWFKIGLGLLIVGSVLVVAVISFVIGLRAERRRRNREDR